MSNISALKYINNHKTLIWELPKKYGIRGRKGLKIYQERDGELIENKGIANRSNIM